MTTTISFSVNTQEKTATQNVKFQVYPHSKIWDSSLPLVKRVANFAVQIFTEAFKYVANGGIHIANSIHSLFHKHTIVPAEATVTATKADMHAAAEDSTPTIDLNSEVDLDEGIPAEEKQGSWLGLALKISAAVAACVGAVVIANKFNLIPTSFSTYFANVTKL